MTLLQEELTVEVTGEAFLAESRGLCEEGAWHGLFCTPRVAMSAPTVSFVQWPVSLVAINCASQWVSRIFRDRLLPPQLAICASQLGWLAGRVVEYFSPALFCFTPIYPHLVNLIKGTHPIEYIAYINVTG